MKLPDMTALALEHERLDSAKWKVTKRAQDKLSGELIAAYRARFPKRKAVPTTRKAQDALPELATARFNHYKSALERTYRCQNARRDRIGRALDWYAKRRAPVTTDSPLEYGKSDYGSYRSQGFGCERYTRKAAEQMAAEVTAQGIKSEIVDWTYNGPERAEPYKFGYSVLAYTDRAGLEIIRRKPVNLKAWLQDCWNRGINPRVLNPFLPHGLEERLGVSFMPQGGQLVSGY